MNKIKIIALILAVLMLLPVIASCGTSKIPAKNVRIIFRVPEEVDEEGNVISYKDIFKYDIPELGGTTELQENVYVNDNSVQGILNYVTGYTQFSGVPEEQEGHYLALQFEASDGAVVTIQTIGGLNDARVVTLDPEMDAVIYVKSTKEKLRVTCTLNGDVITRTISFSGLKLLAQ